MTKPIYQIDMPGAAHQLLWWLISVMDKKQEVHGGWRTAASKALNRERSWLRHGARLLQENGLIETSPRKRYVKVNVNAIRG